MAEPIHRGGTWWHEQKNESWLRFDSASGVWTPASGPPPAPSSGDVQAPPRPATPSPTTAAPPAAPYKSPARWARWAVRLLVVAVLLDGVAVVSDFMEISLLTRIESGEFSSRDDVLAAAERNDDRQTTIAGFQILFLIAAGVAWLGWFRVAYRNLPALGAAEPRFTPGWAVGAWFVPFLNLVRPKQMTDDLWRSSDPTLPPQSEPLWRAKSVHPVVHWWWAFWLVSWFAGRFGATAESEAPTINEAQMTSLLTTISDAASLVAGILAIQIVRIITARQEARVAALATMGAAVAPPES